MPLPDDRPSVRTDRDAVDVQTVTTDSGRPIKPSDEARHTRLADGQIHPRSPAHRAEPRAPETHQTAPVTCDTCAASCCRLEVWCLTETGVPRHFTRSDPFGGTLMDRLDDGWCAALDRNTLLCRIYAQRPLVCRELQAGSPECLVERGSCNHEA